MSDAIRDDIRKAMRSIGKDWKKAKRSADKNDRVSRSKVERLREYKPPRVTMRDVAFKHMYAAYKKVSDNGKYWANARQIMYALRPFVLEETGGRIWKNSTYFTQTLLKDYILEREPSWKVVWDARGNFREPHTGYSFGVGGAEVRDYSNDKKASFRPYPAFGLKTRVKTRGKVNRFGSVLFVEKEGFNFQLREAGILERYDISLMSTKGVPVDAACRLLRGLDIPVLVLHDFDLAGFKILRTLERGTRLERGCETIIDIGLRGEDIGDLMREPVTYDQGKDPRIYLTECGATQDELDILVSGGWDYGKWRGERCEINMLGMAELIEFLERKFEEHGVKKVIPEKSTLELAYKRALYGMQCEDYAYDLKLKLEKEKTTAPDNLIELLNAELVQHPEKSWDEVIWQLVKSKHKKTRGEKNEIN